MSALVVASIVLQTLGLAFLIPSSFALRLIQSKWAPAGDALAAFVTLLGLWIYGGSGYLTYRIPQIVLTIVLLIQQSLGFYVYRKQKVYSEYVAQYLGYAHGIATVVLFALGWYHITAGSLEAVDIRQNYYNIFSHAIFLVIIMIEEIQLISSATGLWPRPGNRTPDYYDSVLILGGALFFFAILVSRYHPNSKGYDLVGRLEHIAYAVMVVCAAATSIMFSTGKRHQNKRNIMPALIVIVLGLLFTSHHQEAMLVKQIHQVFGYTMMVAASFRILEILVLPYWPVNASDVRISLRYMAPLLGMLASFVAFGAAKDLCNALEATDFMASSYVAILYSCGFIYFCFLTTLTQRVKDNWYPDEGDEKIEYSSLPVMHPDRFEYNQNLD